MAEQQAVEKWVAAQLVTVETKISKAGDAAIQLVFKTVDGEWVREWMGLEKCPEHIWKRAGDAFSIAGDGTEAKTVLCNASSAARILNMDVMLGTYQEEFNGKMHTKVADLRHAGHEAPTEEVKTDAVEPPPTIAPKKSGVPQDDFPF
jgi:hypothetical protein